MRQPVFFLVFTLLLLISVGTYLYFRVRPLLPGEQTWKGVLGKILYVLVYVSFLIGFFLQMKGFQALSFPFTYIGSWVLAAIFYLLIIFLMVDVIRLINVLTFKADFLTFKYIRGDYNGRLFSLGVCGLTALILVAGYFNAKFPVTKYLTYKTEKDISQNFKFVLVSDVHLGMINCDRFCEGLKDRINAENPDFVVIAGDFFDGDPYPVINSRVGEILKEIKTGCGIYAVNGNHEWIGNAQLADEFLEKHGITVLRDSVAKLPFNCYIVGREDRSAKGRQKLSRKSLDTLMQSVDANAFSVVLDHQPPRFSDEKELGFDLELSGHTHAGAQLWPLFLITRNIYENGYGELKKGNSTFYTTSGYGTWGPPIRTSARPEIVVIEVEKK